MPFLRDLTLRLLPARWRDEAIAESRLWTTTCSNCGAVSDIWELGGLRWKAAGRPAALMRCRTCGKVAAQRIAKD